MSRYKKFADPSWCTPERLLREFHSASVNGRLMYANKSFVREQVIAYALINPALPLWMLEDGFVDAWKDISKGEIYPADHPYWAALRRHPMKALKGVAHGGRGVRYRGWYVESPQSNPSERQAERYQCLLCDAYLYAPKRNWRVTSQRGVRPDSSFTCTIREVAREHLTKKHPEYRGT